MTITFKNHFQTEKKFLIKQKLELKTFSPKKKEYQTKPTWFNPEIITYLESLKGFIYNN